MYGSPYEVNNYLSHKMFLNNFFTIISTSSFQTIHNFVGWAFISMDHGGVALLFIDKFLGKIRLSDILQDTFSEETEFLSLSIADPH